MNLRDQDNFYRDVIPYALAISSDYGISASNVTMIVTAISSAPLPPKLPKPPTPYLKPPETKILKRYSNRYSFPSVTYITVLTVTYRMF